MAYTGDYAAGQAATSEVRKAPVFEAFVQLDRQIEELAKNIEELTMRLTMILLEDRPVAQERGEAPRERMSVPLAAEIVERRDRLDRLNQAVASLQRRLGI